MFLGLSESASGSKAKSLSLADAYGYHRPNGFVVCGGTLREVLQTQEDCNDLLDLFHSRGLSARKHAEALIYRCLHDSPVLDALVKKSSELGDRVAIRSSFVFEDDPSLTFAGIFESELPVSVERERFCEALVRVWASACSRRFLDNSPNRTRFEELDILIHEYVDFRWLGVSFSRDPTGRYGNSTVIEVGTSTSSIVSGGEGGLHRFVTNRSGEIVLETHNHAEPFEERYLPTLTQMVCSLASEFELGADVEWGITHGGQVYMLQSRSISQAPAACSMVPVDIISFDTAAIRDVRVSRHYRKLINWYWDKRRLCNYVCAQTGVAYQRHLLVRTSLLLDNPASILARIRSELGTDRLHIKYDVPQVMSNSSSVITDGAHIVGLVQQALRERKLGEWVVLKSFFEADASGLASVAGEDFILEAAPGDIGAILQGNVDVSSFSCRQDGSILTSTPCVFTYVPIFDPKTLSTINYEVIPFLLDISHDVRVKIAELTRALSERFGQCRVEWMLCGDRVAFYDLSVETSQLHPLAMVSKEEIVVSPGRAIAPLLILSNNDMEVLRNSVPRRLSVISDVSELSDLKRIERDRNLEGILRRHVDEKVIISAPFPDLNLIPLLPIAAGFIFGAGAILSHFGIILRQAAIPAVIRPEPIDVNASVARIGVEA
ncbi:PEP/pyruvate-binding domain-containing protein [Rhizobium rhizogenes]|uniref:PEP/pyruvate-binding domain-containing protein n=1 Tax=Rhizobium rhizogenes TaxID=359 RepID=UPI0015734FAA|nr:PEP/pyruvate-binding domain-containing protein [Rhizobium rhizogenes]NTF98071.1 hypothetical protein [Rhizobium rhizogenes]